MGGPMGWDGSGGWGGEGGARGHREQLWGGPGSGGPPSPAETHPQHASRPHHTKSTKHQSPDLARARACTRQSQMLGDTGWEHSSAGPPICQPTAPAMHHPPTLQRQPGTHPPATLQRQPGTRPCTQPPSQHPHATKKSLVSGMEATWPAFTSIAPSPRTALSAMLIRPCTPAAAHPGAAAAAGITPGSGSVDQPPRTPPAVARAAKPRWRQHRGQGDRTGTRSSAWAWGGGWAAGVGAGGDGRVGGAVQVGAMQCRWVRCSAGRSVQCEATTSALLSPVLLARSHPSSQAGSSTGRHPAGQPLRQVGAGRGMAGLGRGLGRAGLGHAAGLARPGARQAAGIGQAAGQGPVRQQG